MGRAIYIETYGCQMNVLDSDLVRQDLTARGHRVVQDEAAADVVLLNTCSVREHSEHKVWSKLGRLAMRKALEPHLTVGVIGCMAEREGEAIFDRAPVVDLLCGPSNLEALPRMLDGGARAALSGHVSRRSSTLEAAADTLEALDLSRSFSDLPQSRQAYVRITRGCNKFCSFCVVPFTRGPEVHRAPDTIVEEVRALAQAGALEVTLLGQTVNHYQHPEATFAELLWCVHEAVPSLPRLRFLTSYPRDFRDDILDVMAAAPRICRYLHLPAQSGSNRMLRAMNRGYSAEEYLDLLGRARAKLPDVRIAGDMIVGFPGESDADHQASVALLRAAHYKSCFVFKYSPRPGTVAERRLPDDVPEATKKARNAELLAVQEQQSARRHEGLVGQRLRVLVEDEGPHKGLVPLGRRRLRGRTDGDEIVVFDGPRDWIGQLCDVRITGATPLTLFAAA
jgi:tRNA-2-methylthio-N6-dimethylallyladenosine synthase